MPRLAVYAVSLLAFWAAARPAHAQADTTTTAFRSVAGRFSVRYPATWTRLDVGDSTALAVRYVDVSRRTTVVFTAAARPAGGSSTREIFDSLDDPDLRQIFLDGLAGRGHAHERERRLEVDSVAADTLAGQFAIRTALTVVDAERGGTTEVVAYVVDAPDRASYVTLLCFSPVGSGLMAGCEATVRRLAFPRRSRRRR